MLLMDRALSFSVYVCVCVCGNAAFVMQSLLYSLCVCGKAAPPEQSGWFWTGAELLSSPEQLEGKEKKHPPWDQKGTVPFRKVCVLVQNHAAFSDESPAHLPLTRQLAISRIATITQGNAVLSCP